VLEIRAVARTRFRFLQQRGWKQIDIYADEVVRRSPGWTCAG
jgi:hypothetical protein